MSDQKKLSFKEQLKAVAGVARLSFKVAPGPVLFKLFGAVINAILPIVTTYYAARTTTSNRLTCGIIAAIGTNEAAR